MRASATGILKDLLAAMQHCLGLIGEFQKGRGASRHFGNTECCRWATLDLSVADRSRRDRKPHIWPVFRRELCSVIFGEDLISPKQLGNRALLDDSAVAQHDNHVATANRR
jgi:hypothetical protein